MVNKNHPDYDKYESEFLNIRDKMIDEINIIEIPEINGLDGESTVIHKKYAKKLKYCNKNISIYFINKFLVSLYIILIVSAFLMPKFNTVDDFFQNLFNKCNIISTKTKGKVLCVALTVTDLKLNIC